MSNGLYNGVDNGLYNGLYDGSDIGLKNGLFNNETIKKSSIVTSNLITYLDSKNIISYPKSGTKWKDLTINNNNANLINGAAFNTGNGGYISCDGNSQYIEIPNNSLYNFGTGNFTIEYWFRKTQTTVGTGYDNIWGVNKWTSGGDLPNSDWALSIGNGTGGNQDNYAFTFSSGTAIFTTGESTESLIINKVYQLIGMKNGTNLQVYLNGVLKMDVKPFTLLSNTVVNYTNKNIRINNSYLNSFYTKADNFIVRIYNRALSAQEVLKNYNYDKDRFY